MAQKVSVEVRDDIDGSTAAQTVAFALRGIDYEIDLSDENAASLDKALAPFVAHARRVVGRKRATAGTTAVPKGIDPAVVRAWAAEHGIEVRLRGRIPKQVFEQYRRSL